MATEGGSYQAAGNSGKRGQGTGTHTVPYGKGRRKRLGICDVVVRFQALQRGEEIGLVVLGRADGLSHFLVAWESRRCVDEIRASAKWLNQWFSVPSEDTWG